MKVEESLREAGSVEGAGYSSPAKKGGRDSPPGGPAG